MSGTEQPVLEDSARPDISNLARWIWPGAAIAILMAYLYISIFYWLVNQWWTDPNYSHGFLVPIFAAFLIWKDRKKLRAIEARPSWSGLLILLGGVGVLILGVLGAELFMSRTSFLFIIAGLVVYFRGWAFFRAVFFPWIFLFLMVPPPTLIMNLVTLPLQFLASDLATWFLQLFGVPVLQSGNVLQLPNMSLEVVEACSGIRSLISLATLAIIYGYLLEESYLLRIVLAVAAVPIAVLANGLRIMGTGITGLYWDPDKAQGFFHEFSGWVIFIISLVVLFLLHEALRGLARLAKRLAA